MESRERRPLTPAGLCGFIAHETAALLYGAGADSIPTAETLRKGLIIYASAAGVDDIATHLAWIDSELESAREFESTGQDTAHLFDPDRLNAVADASVQLEMVWELFRAAVQLPSQQDRQAVQELAVTLADMGGLPDILLKMPAPKAPRLTDAGLRAEVTEVSEALLSQGQAPGPSAELVQEGISCDV